MGCRQDPHPCSPPEGVNDHFALDALDGVHHHSHCPRIECLETLQGLAESQPAFAEQARSCVQGSTQMSGGVGMPLSSRLLLWRPRRQAGSPGMCKGAMLLTSSPMERARETSVLRARLVGARLTIWQNTG